MNSAVSNGGVGNEMRHAKEYALGYDAGFRCGYMVGVQDGWATGYDDATKERFEEHL